MKCTSRRIPIFFIYFVLMMSLTGCGNTKYSLPYERNSQVSSFNVVNHKTEAQTMKPFAADLCIASSDKNADSLELSEVSAAGLFDLNHLNTVYSKNLNIVLHPASLTKIMTALVALKNGSPDQMLTASENVKITEPGAQLCGLEAGDRMTLDQALHVLLIYSANDVAMMIAENIGGTVDGFVEMMNQEAQSLGATNSHFVNPNGLTEDEHYVTAYDMYLIFNEAIKYSLITEIIHMKDYATTYYDRNGNEQLLEVENSNMYLRGNYEAPSNVTILGGKTGTTNAAGHCLVLYAKDSSGNPYISIIMNSSSRDALYTQMTDLLKEVKP